MASNTVSGRVQLQKQELNRKETISTQVVTALFLIAEILLVLAKCVYEYVYFIYRFFVPLEEKSLQGEIVLITGTGHGIGKELALQFASLGANVVCWDINKKNNDQTIKEIKEMGLKAHGYECDVTSREQILEIAQKVKSEVGSVSILVNNAGIMPCHPLKNHNEQEIRKIFDINVFAHFWTLEAFLPAMIEKNKGHIVALSSMAGIVGLKNLVPYCASKFAVRGMMESLHEELRETIDNHNIKFTCIYPYMVDTGLCKRPKIRFESQFSMLSPKVVAKKIIQATRRNIIELSIPEYMLPLNNIFRTAPRNVSLALKNFLDAGVESDL